jgi:hypothetical protein
MMSRYTTLIVKTIKVHTRKYQRKTKGETEIIKKIMMIHAREMGGSS